MPCINCARLIMVADDLCGRCLRAKAGLYRPKTPPLPVRIVHNYTSGTHADYSTQYAVDEFPTTFRPGTEEKIAVMAERAARRKFLFHPCDAELDMSGMDKLLRLWTGPRD